VRSMAGVHDTQLAILLAGIATVLLAGLLLGRLARRLGQPAVIGEIAAGILLGPSILGHLPGNLTEHLFPTAVRPLLSAVSQVGLAVFMVLVGWEFERRLIRPHARLAVAVSLGSVVLAFALGVAAAAVVYPGHHTVGGRTVPFVAFATFLGAAMSVTAFPVLARILAEHRLGGTRVGALALACAALDDVLAWCLLAYVSALVTSGGRYTDLGLIALRSTAYVLLMLLVVRPLLGRLAERLSRAERWPALLTVVVAGAFLSAAATTWAGIHALFGAFLFGFVMPREPAGVLAVHLRRPLQQLSGVLLPVFFIITGLGVDLGALTARNALELLVLLVAACAGKLIGAAVPARLAGFSWPETRALGLLMNTRGLTELVMLNAAVSLGVLDRPMFTMMVVMALVTTAMAAPLLGDPDRLAPIAGPGRTGPTGRTVRSGRRRALALRSGR
jgi:Kef-type K+ transport system membrane component KefB